MKLETFNKLISSSFLNRNSITLFVRNNYAFADERTQKSLIRSIRRYVDGSVVPSYEKARELVDSLDIDISEKELMEILDYSKAEKDIDIKYKEPRCVVDLNIRYREIFKDRNLNIGDKDKLLNERIDETCNTKSIKEYIIKLIENDLENEVLDKK